MSRLPRSLTKHVVTSLALMMLTVPVDAQDAPHTGAQALLPWAYALNDPALGHAQDDGKPKHVPGSTQSFTLDEIRSLLSMVEGGDYTCGEVLGLAREHLGAIQAKIRDLKRLQQTLADIAAQCGGGAVPECPIIDALFRDGPP